MSNKTRLIHELLTIILSFSPIKEFDNLMVLPDPCQTSHNNVVDMDFCPNSRPSQTSISFIISLIAFVHPVSHNTTFIQIPHTKTLQYLQMRISTTTKKLKGPRKYLHNRNTVQVSYSRGFQYRQPALIVLYKGDTQQTMFCHQEIIIFEDKKLYNTLLLVIFIL